MLRFTMKDPHTINHGTPSRSLNAIIMILATLKTCIRIPVNEKIKAVNLIELPKL